MLHFHAAGSLGGSENWEDMDSVWETVWEKEAADADSLVDSFPY